MADFVYMDSSFIPIYYLQAKEVALEACESKCQCLKFRVEVGVPFVSTPRAVSSVQFAILGQQNWVNSHT